MAEGSPALATAGSVVRAICCLICDRSLDTVELATCADAHATCPAGADVTYLAKVRSAVAPLEWPDGRGAGDLVCPRCAALVNDIVIYESRLADMMQRLVCLVTTTLTARTGSSEDVKHSDKLKSRRLRKVQPRKNKSSGDISETATTGTGTQSMLAPATGRPRRACKTDRYGGDDDDESGDADDIVTDDPAYAVEQGVASDGAAGERSSVVGRPSEGAKPQFPAPVLGTLVDRLHRRTGRSRPEHPLSTSDDSINKDCDSEYTTYPAEGRLTIENESLRLKPSVMEESSQSLDQGPQKTRLDVAIRYVEERASSSSHVLSVASSKHESVKMHARHFYSCRLCSRSFSSQQKLECHLTLHSSSPYTCDVCAATFSYRHSLRVHRRIHSDEFFSCQKCVKRFRSRQELILHEQTHAPSSQHCCDVCGGLFRTAKTLARHRSVHSGEKPHECSVCGRSFRLPESLRGHMRTHTGERPFVCEVCGKRFARATVLASHRRTHTGEKPYKCPHCQRGFSQCTPLKRHVSNRVCRDWADGDLSALPSLASSGQVPMNL